MKALIETIKNIYKIEELRSRIVYTLMILVIYRLGAHIVLPTVDPVLLDIKTEGVLGIFRGCKRKVKADEEESIRSPGG